MALGIDPGVLAAYAGAMITGFVHGLEPGHGWPLTVRAAAGNPRPVRFGLVASLLLSAGHFISTLVVVLLFFVVAGWLGLLERPLYAIGGILLIAVAVYPYASGPLKKRLRRRREGDRGHVKGGAESGHGHEHDHSHDDEPHSGQSHDHGTPPPGSSMSTIFVSALLLGFVHEEEFALIGFVSAGANALVIGVVYGLCVTISIVGVTYGAIRLASRRGGSLDRRRLAALAHVSSAVMLAIGVYYLFRAAGLA